MKNVLFLAGAAMMTGISAATVHAAPPARPEVIETVRFDDLDLSSPRDRARLERRLASVASRLCAEVSSASPSPAPVDAACFRETMTAARAQVELAVARADAPRHGSSSSASR
jgi:UrcA family protein